MAAILKDQLFADRARRASLVAELTRDTRFLAQGDVVRATIGSPDGRFDLGEQRFTIIDQAEEPAERLDQR